MSPVHCQTDGRVCCLFLLERIKHDYYNEHKRVLPTETKTDFSQLSPAELILLRNNLRSNISHREKTLKKRIAELPPEDDKSFRTKKNFILNKTEEMNELKLQLEEIEKLIKK